MFVGRSRNSAERSRVKSKSPNAAEPSREQRIDTLAETVCDALAWEAHLGLDRPRTRAGLDRADELAVIAGLASG